MPDKFRLDRVMTAVILLAGVILSFIQFMYNRSLWLDEAMVALNIIHRSPDELLKPLDYNQVAPILFLWMEKFFSFMWPDSEYGLRLLPLLSYWGSLFFFYKLTKIIFPVAHLRIAALTLFVFNSTILFYSCEVKQYMVDVLVVTGMYFFLAKPNKSTLKKQYLLSAIGFTSIFLSNAAPVILACCAIIIISEHVRMRRRRIKYLLLILSIWSIAFAIYFVFFIYHHPTRDTMISYWKTENAFMPHTFFSADFSAFVSQKTEMIFTSLMQYGNRAALVLRIFFLSGIAGLLFRRQGSYLTLTLLPLLLHLLLSAFKLYPFSMRLILYCYPPMIILIVMGFSALENVVLSIFRLKEMKALLVIIPLAMGYLFFKQRFPYQKEEIKKSITYMQARSLSSDKLYVYYGAEKAFTYYCDIHFIKSDNPVIMGTANRENYPQYIEELKKLNGRNWLLFSHRYDDEESYIIHGLDSLQYTKLDSASFEDSAVYLYNFK